MLVEFQRSEVVNDMETDEDGLPTVQPQARPIAIERTHVSAVFAAERDGHTIIRLNNGRGFSVVGSYAEVCGKLAGQ